ncbi:hypothetical protein DH2020_046613 [Rehmannia glutinosa]|uniref:Pentatricopeptide repeat-containing protein n=1 Tax=Rehmannia glutinosa TaxID=99300 RepID=A0ABR0UAS6_REHGL
MTSLATSSRHLHQPLSHLLSESHRVIPIITSLLQSLNPQNPKTHQNPDPSVLSQFSPYLTPNLVIQIVKNQTNPYHSLFFFTWASSPSANPNHYRHSHFCYIAITDKLLSHKLFSLAADLLKTHKKFSDFMVGKFIKAHGDLGHLKWAVKLFNQLKRKELDGCLFSFNALLGVLVKAKRVSHAWGTLGRLLLKQFGSAMRCFEEMATKGNCEPNVLTYNVLINGLCLNGDVDEARKMMSRMRLGGLRDNIATHTSLLKGYCIAGRSEEAIKHFKEMVNLGMSLDGKSYAVIVNEYCKLGRPDEAVVILREMRERGINPSLASFNAVLRSFIKLQEFDKAYHILKQMPKWGCYPNFISYSNVIIGLVGSEGRMKDVDVLVNDMILEGHGLDTTLYSSLIQAYCINGNVRKAVCLFKEMISESLMIRKDCFAILVKELHLRGLVHEVENLLDEMRNSCPAFDVETYQSVLNECLCANNGWKLLMGQMLFKASPFLSMQSHIMPSVRHREHRQDSRLLEQGPNQESHSHAIAPDDGLMLYLAEINNST